MSMNSLLAAPLAALATLGLMAAAAPSPAAAAEKAVSYGDLNLVTKSGQKELERRLIAAARDVCETDMITTGTRLRSSKASACYKQTKAQARTQMAAVVQSYQFAAAK